MTAGTRRRTSRPQTISAQRRGRFTAAVKGPVRIVHGELLRLEIPWTWDHRASCYLLPLNRVDDLFAALEAVGHHTEQAVTLW